MLQRLVDRLKRRVDRLADRRPDQRVQDIDQGIRIPSHRAAQGGRQHLPEPLIARRSLGDRGGENPADDGCQSLRIIQHFAEVPGQLNLTTEQEKSQLLELGIERRDAGRFGADIGIDISGQLEQQPRKHLAIEAGIDRSGREKPVERSGTHLDVKMRYCRPTDRAPPRPRA